MSDLSKISPDNNVIRINKEETKLIEIVATMSYNFQSCFNESLYF